MLSMTEKEKIMKCQKAADEMRRDIIEMAFSTGNTGAHLGGSLSRMGKTGPRHIK